MLLIGAHMSVAGGVDRAVERAVATDSTALQIFTKNANQWTAPPIAKETARRFRDGVATAKLRQVVSHDSYLINLASPDDALFEKSLAAFRDELDRAAELDLFGVVTHPGAHVGTGEEAGLRRVAEGLAKTLKATKSLPVKILIENTAGQGSSLGWSFDHLATLLELLDGHPRLGVCLDTCHLHAAGYDLTSDAAYRKTMKEFDAKVGLDRLYCIHVNDSQKPMGSRVDRHADIGEGTLGEAPFARILGDKKLVKVPKILETPKGDDGVSGDLKNLATLRRLAPRPAAR
jgi:deoxyribonuclease-4